MNKFNGKTALDCRNIVDQSLAKARGILFVFSEYRKAETEMESDELEGFALWAALDFLDDVAEALMHMDSRK